MRLKDVMLVGLAVAACVGCIERRELVSVPDAINEVRDEETAIPDLCQLDCAGKICGPDGCGGECGACEPGFECNIFGQCQCIPICEGLGCGSDGCGGSCGDCSEEEACEDGQCVACQPDCAGKDCGDDGCGGSCGNCFSPEGAVDNSLCQPDGVCGATCDQACENVECGSVGDCYCGECPSSQSCLTGECECKPACDGKECGMDGDCYCGACAEGYECAAGECLAAGDCVNTYHDLSSVVQKIAAMTIGKGGHPGEALDVDDNPETCAPADDCEQGLNNQLSGLLSQLEAFVDADAEIAVALEEGSIVLLMEFVSMSNSGSPFTINLLTGSPVEDRGICDYQADKCDYLVDVSSFDPVFCDPVISFDNATISDGKLWAGGADYVFVVPVPIQEGFLLVVEAHMAKLSAVVSGSGDTMKLTDGLLGGAVRKDKLMEAVDLLPEEGLPVGKGMIKNLLDMFVQPDVDADFDGELEAASIGMKFGAIAGNIVGLSAEQ